MPFKGETFGVE